MYIAMSCGTQLHGSVHAKFVLQCDACLCVYGISEHANSVCRPNPLVVLHVVADFVQSVAFKACLCMGPSVQRAASPNDRVWTVLAASATHPSHGPINYGNSNEMGTHLKQNYVFCDVSVR